jgi:DNA ligase-1
MAKSFSPLLAADYEADKLRFPGFLSPKFDGIRALNIDGKIVSRNLKPFNNPNIQKNFGSLNYFDGELVYGSPVDPLCYTKTSSAMKAAGPEDIDYYVFDHIAAPVLSYATRNGMLAREVHHANLGGIRVHTVDQTLVRSMDELTGMVDTWLAMGWEGAMFRDPEASYKFGRSTVNEGILLKIKEFDTLEAKIIGFEEQMQNNNEKTKDAFGNSQRSSHKENKTGKATLGAVIMRGLNGRFKDVEFNCGIGVKGLMDAKFRQEMWDNRERYLNSDWMVEYFNVGCKDKPRFPKLKGPRIAEDMPNG